MLPRSTRDTHTLSTRSTAQKRQSTIRIRRKYARCAPKNAHHDESDFRARDYWTLSARNAHEASQLDTLNTEHAPKSRSQKILARKTRHDRKRQNPAQSKLTTEREIGNNAQRTAARKSQSTEQRAAHQTSSGSSPRNAPKNARHRARAAQNQRPKSTSSRRRSRGGNRACAQPCQHVRNAPRRRAALA